MVEPVRRGTMVFGYASLSHATLSYICSCVFSEVGDTIKLLSKSISSDDDVPLLLLVCHISMFGPLSSNIQTSYTSEPIFTLTVCWIDGFHGVLRSTCALSSHLCSSASSSISTNSPITPTIVLMDDASQARTGIPQHWT